MSAANTAQPTNNPTGELTPSQMAAARREMAAPGFADRLSAHQKSWDEAPSEMRPEWSTAPARTRLMLQALRERMEASNRAL